MLKIYDTANDPANTTHTTKYRHSKKTLSMCVSALERREEGAQSL